ncbi:MAG TPA: hypothetical protein VFP68_16350 [Burkholderiaceae bacterium]|nr:hypothetical protein [Burkholderiaceae bacterium]
MDLTGRFQDMKKYLNNLELAYDEQRNLYSQDEAFLDLLAAAENCRQPDLRLSTHIIDGKALCSREGGMKAVEGLARSAIDNMNAGTWNAVLSITGHVVTMSAKHNPQEAAHVSLVVVQQRRSFSVGSSQWKWVATLLHEHLRRALSGPERAVKPKVWLTLLDRSVESPEYWEGGAICSLASVREVPHDREVQGFHEETLASQPDHQQLLAVRVAKSAGSSQVPEDIRGLLNVPTSEREYELERLKMYRRAVWYVRDILNGAAESRERLQAMKAYVQELTDSLEKRTPLPPARDAEFLDLLLDGVRMEDGSRKLSAHRVDVEALKRRDAEAVRSLGEAVVQGLRDEIDWQATVDFGGHHMALLARHDPEYPGHVSLVLLGGAGSNVSRAELEYLTAALTSQMRADATLAHEPHERKVWLTPVDAMSRQLKDNSALTALGLATTMSDNEVISFAHVLALTDASESNGSYRLLTDGAHALDSDSGVSDPDANLLDQIELYEVAISCAEKKQAALRPLL